MSNSINAQPCAENPKMQSDKDLLPCPQNPFIGDNAEETMRLVRFGILCMSHVDFSDDLGGAAHGHSLFMQVLNDALAYQIKETTHVQ